MDDERLKTAGGGKISHERARLKAETEYEAFDLRGPRFPQPVDPHLA